MNDLLEKFNASDSSVDQLISKKSAFEYQLRKKVVVEEDVCWKLKANREYLPYIDTDYKGLKSELLRRFSGVEFIFNIHDLDREVSADRVRIFVDTISNLVAHGAASPIRCMVRTTRKQAFVMRCFEDRPSVVKFASSIKELNECKLLLGDLKIFKVSTTNLELWSAGVVHMEQPRQRKRLFHMGVSR